MKKKIEKSTFPRKIRTASTPPNQTGSPSISGASGTQGSGFHPPRKRMTNTAEPMVMWAYSLTKKSDHLNSPYSVWKPPTRSASDSGMSKAWRLVSAKSATRKTNADTGMRKMYHMPPQKPGWLCDCTTSKSPSVPSLPGAFTHRNTGSTDNAIESSYEMSCADARTPPRNGYFEFDAQPARMSEYTPRELIANTARMPMSTLAR